MKADRMADDTNLKMALARAPVVPVITVERVEDAAPMALALAAGGLSVLEVTLRTEAGLDAIAAMKAAAPDILVGAGTVRTADDVKAAMEAGSDFLVSPGATPQLVEALLGAGVPALPGTATASEAMTRAEEGFTLLKLFPAVPVGGLALLKSLGAPLPDISFMPTGGISEATAPDFLALPNVCAIGGSWIVNKNDVAAQNWDTLKAKAAAAVALGQER
jgi:2-dehydro-3-deoxyphosphogluconate aldolase/(4S)-4-hydroxy-2-oxoglutarate aldolase